MDSNHSDKTKDMSHNMLLCTPGQRWQDQGRADMIDADTPVKVARSHIFCHEVVQVTSISYSYDLESFSKATEKCDKIN